MSQSDDLCGPRKPTLASDQTTLWWKAAVVCLVFSLVLFLVSKTMADPDLWGHVRFGLDMLREGAVRLADRYSYLSDRSWINHEWMSEILFGASFGLAGPVGLVALKVSVLLPLFGLLYRHLCKRGLSVFRAGVVIILMQPCLPALILVRPQLFTYFGFLLMLLIIVQAEEGRRRWLWAAVPLMCFWTNLHGGFLAGGILGIWWVSAAAQAGVDRGLRRQTVPFGLQPLAACAVAGLSTFLNPYGPRLLEFLAGTAFVERPEIGEWHPLHIRSVMGGGYLLLVAVTVFALTKTRRRLTLGILGPVTVCVLLPLLSVRHLPLFCLAFAVLLADHLADAFQCHWPQERLGGKADPLRMPFICIAAVTSIAFLSLAVPRLRCIQTDLFPIPTQSVALLKKSGVSGKMVTTFGWGEYVIWHLGPEIKVSIDGRRETVYSDERLTRNLNFAFGQGDWDAVLERDPADIVLVSKRWTGGAKMAGPAYNLMSLKPGWVLVHEDSTSALFGRETWPQLSGLQKTPVPSLPDDGKGLCFP